MIAEYFLIAAIAALEDDDRITQNNQRGDLLRAAKFQLENTRELLSSLDKATTLPAVDVTKEPDTSGMAPDQARVARAARAMVANGDRMITAAKGKKNV